MVIRFACPSCQQPIEIDEKWAGQAVGCPYCKRVVTAPASSTWPPGGVPEALPAGSAFQPPPPPPGQLPPTGRGARQSGSAPLALTLAITCTVLSLVGWMVWLGTVGEKVQEKVGANPTQEQVTEALREVLTSGQMPRSSLATGAAFIGVLCGIGGLMLAIRSLLRQEARRGMAIAACIVSVCFTCCVGLLMLMTLAVRSAPGG